MHFEEGMRVCSNVLGHCNGCEHSEMDKMSKICYIAYFFKASIFTLPTDLKFPPLSALFTNNLSADNQFKIRWKYKIKLRKSQKYKMSQKWIILLVCIALSLAAMLAMNNHSLRRFPIIIQFIMYLSWYSQCWLVTQARSRALTHD